MFSKKVIFITTLIVIDLLCHDAFADTQSAFTNLYNKMDKYLTGNTPRLIESFSYPYPGGNELEHKAYVYDSALTALALLNRGLPEDITRAKILCDGFRLVQEIDPFADGRIRDAYWATDLAGPSIYDPGSRCGNLAWIIIALVECYNNDPVNNMVYLQSAINLGNFIINTYKDTSGYYGGFKTGYHLSWGQPYNIIFLNSKSTEENVDIYVTFRKLYEATDNTMWLTNANHAKAFVCSMYNWTNNMYYRGRDENGNIVTTYLEQAQDANAYPILVWGLNGLRFYLPVFDKIGGKSKSNNMLDLNKQTLYFPAPLDWLEENCLATDLGFVGFDFNTDRDGVWFEGTGNMCIAYDILNMPVEYNTYLNELRDAQIEDPINIYRNGALPSASRDYLSTGLGYWYFNSPHVAATCWYIFAEERYNPLEY